MTQRITNHDAALTDLRNELTRLRALRAELQKQGSPGEVGSALYLVGQEIKETLKRIAALEVEQIKGVESYDD